MKAGAIGKMGTPGDQLDGIGPGERIRIYRLRKRIDLRMFRRDKIIMCQVTAAVHRITLYPQRYPRTGPPNGGDAVGKGPDDRVIMYIDMGIGAHTDTGALVRVAVQPVMFYDIVIDLAHARTGARQLDAAAPRTV